ncbi:MAG TPA: superinfection immunity protein [Actinomycetota bacterium]|nr:superinfection immunity protein [Actinomycetota bacterium]
MIGFDGSWFLILGFLIFLLPLLIAVYRQTNNIFLVGILNIFLGATGIVWFIALYLALKAPRHSAFFEKH